MARVYRHIKQLWIPLCISGLFLLTRAYIWFNPPVDFTEIIYSYMPYAHLWASGVKPYLEQWYEYPPATIPLFYLPHLIDRQTYGSFCHIDYRQAYRGLLLLVDTALFALLWRSLVRFGTKPQLRLTALVYYCLITTKANHFLYDTMDWTFAGALALSVSPAFWVTVRSRTLARNLMADMQTWLGYWLAVGLKLLNGPLGLPLALLQRRRWRTGWLALAVAGGLVWGLPLLIYRSSLSVMLVFHQMRGLQVDSLTAVIVRIINGFTQTESVIEIYKNYEMTGPVTTQALGILSFVFPLALVVFTGWMVWQAWRLAPREKDHSAFRLSMTLGFVLLLMIVSKVLSRPFVLWHIPLLAMLPLANWRQQLRFLVPSVIAVVVTLSFIPDVPVGILSTATLVGVVRSLAFVWLFVEWFRWHRRRFTRQV
ncbi:MAG: hypothetical protein ABIJ33_01865 [Patescibacteria group bacterium]